MQNKEITTWQDKEALRRYITIMPLLEPDIDEGKKRELREKIAAENGLSTRTVYRYEKSYNEGQFQGLKPVSRAVRKHKGRPENFDEIINEAIQLKKEVPRRSIRQIIKILELEGWAEPGLLKKSTLQRYLFNAGFGRKQMQRYVQSRESSSKRFCRPHRMELIQGDIKYGPSIRQKDGKVIKTYLSSLIDDHSRYILQSEFYPDMKNAIVEDTFHKAVLQHGHFDSAYLDHGSQYVSKQLLKSCTMLGITLRFAPVKSGKSKGKIEKFHQVVDRFIAEIKVSHVDSVEELNRRWKIFLDQDYHKTPHDGIADYYRAKGVDVPPCGITPEQEWNRDTRELSFIDVKTVSNAFLHHEERQIDQAGCFSFEGEMYEASVSLAGAKVEIAYDPMNTDVISVIYQGKEAVTAHKVKISSFASKSSVVPESMNTAEPETSRFLDALENNYNKEHRLIADAISFGNYGKAGDTNV